MNDPIRLVMVDDYPLLVAGVQVALEQVPDIQLVAFADPTIRLVELCKECRPDVLILGTTQAAPLPLDVIAPLRERYPNLKILLLTTQDRADEVDAALRGGASGAAAKEDPIELVEQAIHAVHRGKAWVSPTLAGKATDISPPPITLTEREREVLTFMARGWNNAAIAAELVLAEQTVRNYVSQLYNKLGVSSRGEAVVWALEHGFGKG